MQNFWHGRHVLVTGQTGFKGAWLCLWLERLGAKISAFALAPHTDPSLYHLCRPWHGQDHALVDLRDPAAVAAAVARLRPQIIFHLGAQALVRASFRDPLGTYATNVMGTLNLLAAAAATPGVEAAVMVTTDKVYENDQTGRPFPEGDRLGGKDPYSNSKACAELAVQSFRDSFLGDGRAPAVATARAGNVVGGGDWAEDRLVPDMVRALGAGRPVALRYPASIRPWQHVLEPLKGYLMLAERLVTAPAAAPTAVNFGPAAESFVTVAEVVSILDGALGGGAGWRQAPGDHPPEAAVLTLDSTLARDSLGWRPRLSMRETIGWTADWYRGWRDGRDPRQMTFDQIDAYQTLCLEESAS